jgi:hypothetical protein
MYTLIITFNNAFFIFDDLLDVWQEAHPSWQCSPSGQSLVERKEQHHQDELAAVTREQDLYRQAAARQLEILALLEQQRASTVVETLATMNETYFLSHEPADAGAGTLRRLD